MFEMSRYMHLAMPHVYLLGNGAAAHRHYLCKHASCQYNDTQMKRMAEGETAAGPMRRRFTHAEVQNKNKKQWNRHLPFLTLVSSKFVKQRTGNAEQQREAGFDKTRGALGFLPGKEKLPRRHWHCATAGLEPHFVVVLCSCFG